MFLFITVCLLYIIINKTCLWKPAHVHILWIKEDLNAYVVNTNICTIFKGFEEADVEAAKKKKEKKKGSKWKFVFIYIDGTSKKSILRNVLCWFRKKCICVYIVYAIFMLLHVSLYSIGRNIRGDIILSLKIAYCS